MEIRRARAEELEAIGELTALAYADFTQGPDDPYIERLKDAAARDREGELWIATHGGQLMGTVTYCAPGTAWREIGAEHEGEFRMLAVHPEARGVGVGTALAEHCERRAREQGATAMALSSLAGMLDAHRIYLRLGYRRAPERDWSPVPGVHLVVFSKEL